MVAYNVKVFQLLEPKSGIPLRRKFDTTVDYPFTLQALVLIQDVSFGFLFVELCNLSRANSVTDRVVCSINLFVMLIQCTKAFFPLAKLNM